MKDQLSNIPQRLLQVALTRVPARFVRCLLCGCLSLTLVRCLLCGCLSLTLVAGHASSVDPARLYWNAHIYTMDERMPQAAAMLVENGRIAWIGEGTPNTLPTATERIDLQGRFVMPGLIDAHTHPGIAAILGGEESGGFATDSREAFFRDLEEVANDLDGEDFIMLAEWDVAMFLPEGPHKADLDRLFGNTPVVFSDNSGHSFWLNSAALAVFGVDRETPDLSPGLSYFVRDDSGEPTGWVKEFAIVPMLTDALFRTDPDLFANLGRFLGYLSEHGITALFDGGNFNASIEIYDRLAELDRRGALALRYHGSHHVYLPDQFESAISELKALRERYANAQNLKFDAVKIHYDGVIEVDTAAMLDPYLTDGSNRGAVLANAERVADLLLELDREGIDLHLHSVGDRSTQEILDAVELALAAKGEALEIEVTLSHLEYVHATDVPRFHALGIHANFTPQWFEGIEPGTASAAEMQVGSARLSVSQPANTFVRHRANVTFSSDITTLGALPRARPFVGVEMSITRRDYGNPTGARLGPESERVSLDDALRAYTVNGARQLGRAHELGMLREDYLADFIVLAQNPFEVRAQHLHRLKPEAVVLGGRVVAGVLPVAKIK